MRRLYTLIFLTFLLLTSKALTFVQFINNSPDSTVIWAKVTMNGDLKKDSLQYRKATTFISFPGDLSYTITFRSIVDTNEYASTTQTLVSGRKYVFVLNGVGNDTTYDANPDGISVLLNVVMIDQSTISPPA